MIGLPLLHCKWGVSTKALTYQSHPRGLRFWEGCSVFINNKLQHQFFSAAEILAAAAGPKPEITLYYTNKLFHGGIVEHTKVQ